MAKTPKVNSAGVDSNGFIVEQGYFPKGALEQLQKGKGASQKKTSTATKKGKK